MSWETVHSILAYCRQLTTTKSDVVVVGSTAFYIHGLHILKPNDLDIVVCDLKGLEGDIHNYSTYSSFSKSGKRACILENGITKIDIFVENSLPDYQIIAGIRVASKSALYFYYTNLLPKVAEHLKKGISYKIKVLKYGK